MKLIDYFKKIIKVIQNLKHNSSVLNQDIGGWSDQYEKGQNRKTKIVIILSALGIVLFLGIAILLPFRDKLFNLLYPKRSLQAAFCDGNSLIPSEQQGFVYTGGDLSQEIEALNTSLYYSYDTSLGPNRKVFLIGKYASNYTDPLGLHLLMGDNLGNTEFKGLAGQSPVGWISATAGGSGDVVVETLKDNTLSSQTSVKITNHKSPSGTQISQVFKDNVSEGNLIVFGTWVKASDSTAVKLFIQEGKAPFTEFGQMITPIKAGKWNFVLGYGKVPAGVTTFQIVLRVTGQENIAWFDHPAAVVINGKANQQLTRLVSERCGSAWFIDNEPKVDSTMDPYIMEPVSAEIYALLYDQFYKAIKEIDPAALVLPGGLAWAADGNAGYSPKVFLDSWRTAYKGFFGTEPPLDALNIHYLAVDSSRWLNAKNLENYLGGLRIYIDGVLEWKGKPIWISELGVSSGAPNGGIDFLKSSLKFLGNNNLNIAKWFWFDTCSFNPNLVSLFQSKSKICTWPVKLTNLGENYSLPKPTVSPVPSISPNLVSTPSAEVIATPILTPTPTATASAILVTPTPSESTASSLAK